MKEEAAAEGKKLTRFSSVDEWNWAFHLAQIEGPAAVQRLKAKLTRIINPIIEKKVKAAKERT